MQYNNKQHVIFLSSMRVMKSFALQLNRMEKSILVIKISNRGHEFKKCFTIQNKRTKLNFIIIMEFIFNVRHIFLLMIANVTNNFSKLLSYARNLFLFLINLEVNESFACWIKYKAIF